MYRMKTEGYTIEIVKEDFEGEQRSFLSVVNEKKHHMQIPIEFFNSRMYIFNVMGTLYFA